MVQKIAVFLVVILILFAVSAYELMKLKRQQKKVKKSAAI